MTITHAIILGIIEGLTEFIPVSSTGHLIVSANLMGIDGEFIKSFEIFIQLGAILAVLIIYAKRILNNKKNILNLVIAFIPTAILGLFLYKIVRQMLGNSLIVPISLILGGLIIILIERHIKQKQNKPTEVFKNEVHKKINKQRSFILGIVQALAFIPGVSRSGALIIGGLVQGISRREIVEFSFMLAIPTMLAATGYDLYKNGFNFSPSEIGLLLAGFASAFLTAILAIKFFIKYIQNHSFKIFGWYRIIAGIIFLIILL